MRAKGRLPMGMRQTELRQPASANRICRVAAYLNKPLHLILGNGASRLPSAG